MPDEVKIPVKVVGGQQAQRELQELQQAAQQSEQTSQRTERTTRKVGQAADETAKQTKKQADATKVAGVELGESEKKAEKVVKTLLGQFNPALANTFDLLDDVADGALAVNKSMVALIGLSVGLGVVVSIFEQMAKAQREAAEAAQKLLEAQRKARDEQVSQRRSMQEDLLGAGVVGETVAVTAANRENALRKRGIPEGIARNVAIAEQVGGVTAEDADALLAGVIFNRGQSIEFNKPRADVLKQIEKLIELGESSDGKQALEKFEIGARPVSFEEAIDRELDALKKRFPQLQDRTLKTMRELALQSEADRRDDLDAGFFDSFWGFAPGAAVRDLKSVSPEFAYPPLPPSRLGPQEVGIADRAAERIRESALRSMRSGEGTGVTIINNVNTQNNTLSPFSAPVTQSPLNGF